MPPSNKMGVEETKYAVDNWLLVIIDYFLALEQKLQKRFIPISEKELPTSSILHYTES